MSDNGWLEVGSIGDEEVHFLAGFDGGYLAYVLEPARAWFSADGSAWQAVDLAHAEAPCVEDGEAYPDRIEAAAANGSGIVMLGVTSVAHPRDGDCALLSMAWVSSDGRSWQRADPFGELRWMYVLDAPPSTVAWASADRFETLIHFHPADYDQPPDEGVEPDSQLWVSADGLRWEQADVDLSAHWARATADAATDGTRLLSLYVTCPGTCVADALDPTALVVSSDGVAWEKFESPWTGDGAEWVVTNIRGPSSHADYWTLVTQRVLDPEEFLRESAIWTSADLDTWQRHDSPAPRLGDTLPTSVGLVATGCDVEWDECVAFVTDASSSGSAWQPMMAPGQLLVDGPAGLLAIGPDGRVWRFVQD